MHNLFASLKADTHHKHNELESTSPFVMFNDMAHVDTTLYANVIAVMQQFHTRSFDYLSGAANTNPLLSDLIALLDATNIVNALKDDVGSLNKANISSLPAKGIPLPTFDSEFSATIAGIYVWLGSSMGANIIVRRLTQQHVALPITYYTSMSQCARNWTIFKQKTALLLSNEHDVVSSIVDDANRWFDYLIQLGKEQTSLHRDVASTMPHAAAK
jgi:heme oxygenase